MRTHLRLFLVALLLLVATPSVGLAQKVARKPVACPEQGFQFKPLDKFSAVPIDGGKGSSEALKFAKDRRTIVAYSFEDERGDEEAEEGRTVAKKKRKSILGFLKGSYQGFTDKVGKNPVIDEEVEIDGLTAKHLRFTLEWGSLDVWSFPLKHADIHLVYQGTGELDKKWAKAFGQSAESFEQIERVTAEEIDTSSRSFEDQLAWAEAEAAKVEGWRAIGTPSKRFVVLTNATKKAFIKEVLKRLEVSRDVYEKDFPPPADFNAVSVIRICRDREEFQRFSGAGGGVAGYFSPMSVELVLYDNVETDRNSTYAVVSHEAFHQYCHFLFGQSEAHRWFDEGHGDYYGGMKIAGSRGKITPKMPSGLDRLSVIRDMVREESYKPLSEHLYFNHRQWQSQGPSNVSCYAQSWSVIYMLRQGALRKVSRKVWEDEYADIIPNYVSTLNQGFQDAYKEIRDKRIERAEKKGLELDPSDLKINRFDLDPRQKQKIWDAAMEASWGQVDLDEFEANWVLYIQKYLK
ncbi:MAG: hypothetical protein P8M11_09905 [Planctomycetota bacterium]|nr:hypothetical protein [Planctomycetota bacterium]MDG1984871.1 hypothetical protein [Planctomycetota bacterium]